jgi:hypothetical protein
LSEATAIAYCFMFGGCIVNAIILLFDKWSNLYIFHILEILTTQKNLWLISMLEWFLIWAFQ